MKRILVIADDLTGAAEIGGIALRHGLAAQIQCGRFEACDANVVILDTDTRHCGGGQAAGRIKRILNHVDARSFDLIYKKTDSVLRGPVAAELNAVMGTVGIAHALLVPQNPSRGRVIINGEYKIHGEPLHQTPLAADPEHPADTSNVRQLLGTSGAIDAIHIGDGASGEQLARWARSLDAATLPAGGADFFTAVLEARGLTEISAKPYSAVGQSSLMVCGSAVKGSRDFVAAIAPAARGLCPMPQESFDADSASEAAISGWANAIGASLQTLRRAMIAVPQEPRAERARHVRETIAEVVAQVLGEDQPGTLFIEGGATAAAIAARMNWRKFDVVGQIAPGVVGMRVVSRPHQIVVIKPGSYAWPAEILA